MDADLAYRRYHAVRTFGSLDGLRGAAILAVIWHHTAGASSSLPPFNRGFRGLDLFFTLSGFLIVTLLLRERDRNGAISLGRFFVRRSLRIFPLYYALLAGPAIVFGCLKPAASQAGEFFDKLPYYLTYTSNWLPDATLLAVAWSLATEVQF